MALSLRGAGAGPRAHPARGRRGSSSKATCSTGGTSRPAAACAAAARTTCCGCRSWSPSTSRATGDTGVLDEQVPFLTGAAAAGPTSPRCYDLPQRRRAEAGTLFEHCRRAIDRGMTSRRARPAAHRRRRLERRHEPRRPRRPRREHVARVLHLHACSNDFVAAVREPRRPRAAPRATGRRRASSPSKLEEAWDGEWYRRGYYDDGTPLGSAQNDECRIDSIAQSWAVLSGAVPARFAERAMDAVRAYLIARQSRIILLLTPPSITRRRTPATSRAIRRASARTAASTPTRRSGW